jgi:hypothetical protein
MSSISAFMLANVGAERDPKMGEFFDTTYAVPASVTSITRVDRDNVFTYDRAYDAVVDDFDQASGVSSNRKPNIANGVTVTNDASELPTRAQIAWTAAGADHYVQLNWADAGAGREVTAFTSLDFRVGRPLDQIREPSAEFSVALVDSTGALSTPVPVTKYADVFGPVSEVNLYQTVRIPLSDFGVGPRFKVQGVRLIFDKSPKGELYFANVRFAANNPLAFAGSLDLPLAPEEIVPTVPSDDSTESAVSTNPTPSPNSLFPPNAPMTATPLTPSTPKTTSGTTGPLTPSFGFDPLASVRFNTAHILRTNPVASSKYMSGKAALEIAVAPTTGLFPAEAQLPTLVMAGNKFSVSRYPPTGRLNALIFSISRDDFAKLPDRGAMWVQYGRVNPRKVWNLPNFVKSELTP